MDGVAFGHRAEMLAAPTAATTAQAGPWQLISVSRAHEPASRRRRAGDLRGLRSLPAALPDVPGHRRGGALASGPDRRDAGGRGGRGDRPTRSSSTFMSTCVQCRGCEPACPSGVPYGHLIEGHARRPRRRRSDHAVVAAARLPRARPPSHAARRLDRCSRSPSEPGWCRRGWGLGRLPVRRGAPVRVHGNRRLDVHRVRDGRLATRDPSGDPADGRPEPGRRAGCPEPEGACCGALHVHAGLEPEARRLAGRVIASMPGDAPVLVNSAGCGAQLKEYGRLLGTPEAVTLRGAGARHPRMARRRATDRLGRPARRLGPGHRPGPVPPAPCAEGPPAGPDPARCGRRGGRARRRRPVLRGRRRLQRPGAGTRRRRSGIASWPRSRGPLVERRSRRGQRQPRVAPCISPPPA